MLSVADCQGIYLVIARFQVRCPVGAFWCCCFLGQETLLPLYCLSHPAVGTAEKQLSIADAVIPVEKKKKILTQGSNSSRKPQLGIKPGTLYKLPGSSLPLPPYDLIGSTEYTRNRSTSTGPAHETTAVQRPIIFICV